MSEQAQNALLKVLEEPPPNVVFLLTAPSASALLPTVRSRVQSVPPAWGRAAPRGGPGAARNSWQTPLSAPGEAELLFLTAPALPKTEVAAARRAGRAVPCCSGTRASCGPAAARAAFPARAGGGPPAFPRPHAARAWSRLLDAATLQAAEQAAAATRTARCWCTALCVSLRQAVGRRSAAAPEYSRASASFKTALSKAPPRTGGAKEVMHDRKSLAYGFKT